MLDDPKNEEIIRWNSDNISFIVIDRDRLLTEVFPNYFNHRKFASFARQLLNYGFRRSEKTALSKCIYVHQTNLFRREEERSFKQAFSRPAIMAKRKRSDTEVSVQTAFPISVSEPDAIGAFKSFRNEDPLPQNLFGTDDLKYLSISNDWIEELFVN